MSYSHRTVEFHGRQSASTILAALKLSVLAVVLLVSAVSASGQIDTGAVVGTVADSSGAAIPNATVQVRDEATGLVLTQQATAKGNYEFTALKIGNYTVTASAPGFQRD